MSKLGFRFAAVPKDRHPEWFEVSLLARCLGLELFATIYDEKTRAAEVAVAESWTVSLCRLMRVEARERQAACRALEALHRHGLLVIENGKATLVFRADQELGKSPASAHQAGVKPGSSDGQAGVKPSQTIGDDSTPESQTDKKEEIRAEVEAERASAREDFGGSRVVKLQAQLPEHERATAAAAWLSRATGQEAYSTNSASKHYAALLDLASKPEAQKSEAARVLKVEGGKPRVGEFLTPQHVVDNWRYYGKGNAPGRRSTAQPLAAAASSVPTEVEKLTAKIQELDRAERACLYDEEEKKERIQKRKRELYAQIESMSAEVANG